jgi:putative transposase
MYFSQDLTDYHGETVRVGYDIHDASRVWVRNKAGQLICIAGFEANKRSYFPQSFMDKAAETRAKGRLRSNEIRRQEIEAELEGARYIEEKPVLEIPTMSINNPREQRLPSTPDVQIVENGVLGNVIEMPVTTRPMFDTQAGKYRWLNANPREITNEDEAWLDYYRLTAEWSDLFGDREVATR